jgi:GntR family transcriptional regulator
VTDDTLTVATQPVAVPPTADPVLGRPDRSRPEPLWHQVVQALREPIDNGVWSPGDRLPGEGRLCELLGVSRITVRHALRTLEAQGLVRKEHGRGTFVTSDRLVGGARSVSSFSREMVELGRQPGSVLLEAETVPAEPSVASALELRGSSLVVRIRRLRTGDGQPIGIQTAHLRADRVSGLDPREIATRSLYEVLDTEFSIRPTEANEVYRVGSASEDEAHVLEIEPGTPVFVVKRLARDDQGPFEFTISTMRGDRYEIRSTLRSEDA